ncbi:hypothetical protein COO91_05377 [Nostoc flagelliforme CCNUN1]|uniref:Uncharacterized protein n=1 Tax=Nostoc flagelliforme CCNUN1 TaxID=2038116 RepID=A0A2K8SV90_9NOSO|nr:hypothetical protein COO91_05377 [Nostoc flagelliforme CCNUN1]
MSVSRATKLDALTLDYFLNPKNPTPNPSPQAGRGDKAQLWRGGVLFLWVIWRT